MLGQLRENVTRMRSDLVGRGEIALQRPTIIKGVECAVRFAMGVLLSNARIFGNCAPFGAAAVAAGGTGAEGAFTLAGVLTGYLFAGSLSWAIKYIAISSLIYVAAFMFSGIRVLDRLWVMPVAASFVAACTGAVYAAGAQWELVTTVLYLTETILIGGTAYFYKLALSPWHSSVPGEEHEMRRGVGILILTACVLVTVQRFSIAGTISVGRTAAVFIVMLASYRGGLTAGAATGTALGIAMDAAMGATPFFSMAYAFAGIISGAFHRCGKLLFTLGFIAASAVSALWVLGDLNSVSILYEVFISTVVFMLIPSRRLAAWGAAFASGAGGDSAAGVRSYARERLERASTAFRTLYETMQGGHKTGDGREEVAAIFDTAADRVCRNCNLSRECWKTKYADTVAAMTAAVPNMMDRRRLEKEDFPERFQNKCLKPEQFTIAVNEELKGFLYRRSCRNKLSENRSVLYAQYADMAEVLSSVANELGAEMYGNPPAERRLQKYLKGLDIDARTSVFRDKRGRLHAEIRGGGLSQLTGDTEFLNKLSAVVGVRLCDQAQAGRTSNRLLLMEAEPYAATVGVSAARKRGESVSGDNGVYFKTDDGVLCVMLADGMGTGESAAVESRSALTILERFLRAGVEPETALKIFNSIMYMKNEDGIRCTTVDLVCIDLFSGETKVFKYGAAPSYIKRGAEISAITGETLAAGLCIDGVGAPDCARLMLSEGSFVVIASDGVASSLDDDWLEAAAAAYEGRNARELAATLLEKAVRKYGQNDDMMVLAVYLEKRN